MSTVSVLSNGSTHPPIHVHNRERALQHFNLLKFPPELYIPRGPAPRSAACLSPTSGGFCAQFCSPAWSVLGLAEKVRRIRQSLYVYMHAGSFFKLALVSSQLVFVAIRPCFRRKFSSRTSCVKYDYAQGLYIFTFLYLSLKFYSCWNTAWMC